MWSKDRFSIMTTTKFLILLKSIDIKTIQPAGSTLRRANTASRKSIGKPALKCHTVSNHISQRSEHLASGRTAALAMGISGFPSIQKV
jgi:hypothetical protein